MDELIKTFNVILNFVEYIQHSCDQRRILLETSFNKEYQHYVKEWTRKEEERKQKEEKERQEKESIRVVQESIEALELEEISKADDLLRKARLIREKIKVPSLDDFIEKDSKMLTKISNKMGLEYHQKDVSHNKLPIKKLKQSTSMPSINSNRINITNLNKNRQTKDQNKGIRNTLPRDKCLKTSKNVSIITKTQLNSYLQVSSKQTSKIDTIVSSKGISKNGSSISTNKSCGGNRTSKAPLAVVQSVNFMHTKHLPTYQDFLNFTHERQNFLLIDLSQNLWYPVLDSKNASRLTSNIKCHSAKELKQVCTLLYSIQEMAFWLDLFHLIGNELIPWLKNTSINQQDAMRIKSYIQSIFHPTFHRTPIILQPDFE